MLQRVLLYLVSRINPEDDSFQPIEFSVSEYCAIAGIDTTNGKHYIALKSAIKSLADKSIWITMPDGKYKLFRWISTAEINPNSGIVQIQFFDGMKPYLLKLRENFTSFQLVWTLRFRSKFSHRLYELIKSIHYNELESYTRTYPVDELRRIMGAEHYGTYQAFKARALSPACDEINEYSDKTLAWTPIKTGKQVTAITLTIGTKDAMERIELQDRIEKELGILPGQVTLWDMMKDREQRMEQGQS